MGITRSVKGKERIGAVVLPGATLQAKRIPLKGLAGLSATAEFNAGLTLPVGAIVQDCFLDIRTGAGDTAHVGLNGTGGDDDPDGFLASVSVATTGNSRGTIAVAGAGTRGALLKENAFSAASACHVPRPHMVYSASPLTVTLSTPAAALDADIVLLYLEV